LTPETCNFGIKTNLWCHRRPCLSAAKRDSAPNFLMNLLQVPQKWEVRNFADIIQTDKRKTCHVFQIYPKCKYSHQEVLQYTEFSIFGIYIC